MKSTGSVPSEFAVKAVAYLQELQECFKPTILEAIESLADATGGRCCTYWTPIC